MAQCLELQGHEVVLDIGSGSGFHAAVLGALAARVISVEVIPELAAAARANLERAGRIANVRLFLGDASAGWPQSMPYDAISVAAAAASIPNALIEQLADPGRLVIPVGPRDEQELILVTKSRGRIQSTVVTGCRFVPLVGGS
jgi:protein-L-isoaspartate(D-aspartate) O-methyltransferase